MRLGKDLGRSFAPLNKTLSLVVEGGSTTQIFRPDTNEFVPDRGITPIIIRPEASIVDTDGILQAGNVNAELAAISWKANGVSVAGNPDYTVSLTADNRKGALTVRKNISAGEQVVLEFEAQFLDTRTGNLVKFGANILLNTNVAAQEEVAVSIDYPAVIDWNPIKDPQELTITASAKLGVSAISGNQVKYFLYKVFNGQEIDILEEHIENLEVTSFVNGVFKLEPEYIDGKDNYRLYADYVKPGTAAPAAPTNRAAHIDFTVRRRFPQYNVAMIDYGEVQPWQRTTKVKAEITLIPSGEVVQDPKRYFDIRYLFVRGTSEVVFGTGNDAELVMPFGLLSYESSIAMEINEKTNLRALADDLDNILTDNADNILTDYAPTF